jgi:hypothetical protein
MIVFVLGFHLAHECIVYSVLMSSFGVGKSISNTKRSCGHGRNWIRHSCIARPFHIGRGRLSLVKLDSWPLAVGQRVYFIWCSSMKLYCWVCKKSLSFIKFCVLLVVWKGGRLIYYTPPPRPLCTGMGSVGNWQYRRHALWDVTLPLPYSLITSFLSHFRVEWGLW